MRGEALRAVLKPQLFDVIDTHVPFFECKSLFRSLAFRLKIGPVLTKTNAYIRQRLSGTYDLIWVDKAIFIHPAITNHLKSLTTILIHYTPDTAFAENVSRFFNKSLAYYDYVITTKSFERMGYLAHIKEEKLLYIPQGYNKDLHYPRHEFDQKKGYLLFIGLCEPAREKVIDFLLQYHIPVVLAGKNWKSFVKKNENMPLTYLGEGLFGEAYAEAVSEAQLALGLVSKRFPELHTTRTFEIPACGTALITERNDETIKFFHEDEVIFYSSLKEMAEKVKAYLDNPEALRVVSEKGLKKVREGGYDYREQLMKICQLTGVLPYSITMK